MCAGGCAARTHPNPQLLRSYEIREKNNPVICQMASGGVRTDPTTRTMHCVANDCYSASSAWNSFSSSGTTSNRSPTMP